MNLIPFGVKLNYPIFRYNLEFTQPLVIGYFMAHPVFNINCKERLIVLNICNSIEALA